MTRTRIPRNLALAVLAATSIVASFPDATASEGFNAHHALVGAWKVQVSPVNCTTGVPFTTNPVYITFGKGGTVSESTGAPSFAPGQRTSGHGRWERTGPGEYEAVYEAFVLFDSPPPGPYRKGIQRFEHVIDVTDTDHWTSVAKVAFFDAAGNPIGSGCATAEAERLK